jgi:hypothetical protein
MSRLFYHCANATGQQKLQFAVCYFFSLVSAGSRFKHSSLGLWVNCFTTVPMPLAKKLYFVVGPLLTLVPAGSRFEPSSLGLWVDCCTTVLLPLAKIILWFAVCYFSTLLGVAAVKHLSLGWWVNCSTIMPPSLAKWKFSLLLCRQAAPWLRLKFDPCLQQMLKTPKLLSLRHLVLYSLHFIFFIDYEWVQ